MQIPPLITLDINNSPAAPRGRKRQRWNVRKCEISIEGKETNNIRPHFILIHIFGLVLFINPNSIRGSLRTIIKIRL